ncbi:hypothetical protein PPYR_14726 [Photinus pyralis]|uniref:Uncharacterized protein n=1 Tax=Photinus pyralis TaxID=7054 RepID=A0A5N4A619_PHOPY|nr:hypothetical protein PPYR_14726 [Photinus pyralis]
MRNLLKGLTLAAFVAWVFANPKKYVSGDSDSGFHPNNQRYYESNLPGGSRHSNISESKEMKESSAINRYQRFGNLGLQPPSGYGNTGSGVQGYPPGGVGYNMVPMKIDIGGVALGAALGLGAVLLAPKLFSFFHMLAPGYRNSSSSNSSAISDILARIDNSLEEHHIDSSSCMQRIICSYVNEAQKNVQNGEQSTVDELLLNISNNSLVTYMLDGSAVKQAIDMGKQGDLDKCASLYVKCPISRENVLQVISSLLPS